MIKACDMPDKQLFLITSTLIAISAILVYSLSSYVVLRFGYNEFHFLIRQVGFSTLSIVIMWWLAQLNPDVWLSRIGFLLFWGPLFLMVLMPFLPAFLVSEVGGAKRWIKIAGFSLAPVEFFKIGFVYFLAWSFSRKLGHHDNMGVLKEFIRFSPYAIMFSFAIIVIAVGQKDLGQVAVLGVTLLFLLFLAGSSFRFFFALIGSAVFVLVLLIVTQEHRIARVKSWWSVTQDFVLSIFPESIASHLRVESFQEPYQVSHSLNAIHNGGIIGTGLSNGTFKLGFLSEVHTDFILAGLAEEFGFIGVLTVTLLMMALLWRIFKVANRTDDKVISLFSVGIGLLIAFAFLINAYGISGLIPIKGISVPFLSYGGSSILAASIGVGMVLMASRNVKYD